MRQVLSRIVPIRGPPINSKITLLETSAWKVHTREVSASLVSCGRRANRGRFCDGSLQLPSNGSDPHSGLLYFNSSAAIDYSKRLLHN